jgi:hypothetical protein
VATGGYSVKELEPYRPWQLFEELPSVDQFMELITEGPLEGAYDRRAYDGPAKAGHYVRR